MNEEKDHVSVVGNLWIRMFYLGSNQSNEGHKHLFDHHTLLATGSVAVEINGVSTEFSAPQVIVIEKNTTHRIIAGEDGALCYCIHPLRDQDGEMIDPNDVPLGGHILQNLADK
jgi:quercetin dioxygenase-like cupin family protein